MPITVYEKFGSPVLADGEDPSAELTFVIRGTSNELEAHAALVDAAPLSFDGLVRKASRLEPITGDTWEGSIRYGKREKPPGTVTLSFDTGGGNQHITQSLGTFDARGIDGTTPPNYRGAIGVTGDGVDGVSITVPVFQFSETHILPFAVMTEAYRATLFNLTGTVNNAPFRGHQAGEVLFMGASGTTRENEDGELEWEIAYKFGASPNATGLVVGEITGINKRGWDYLWVRYADHFDRETHTLGKKAVAVYVEQVYRFGNFAALGIGS